MGRQKGAGSGVGETGREKVGGVGNAGDSHPEKVGFWHRTDKGGDKLRQTLAFPWPQTLHPPEMRNRSYKVTTT